MTTNDTAPPTLFAALNVFEGTVIGSCLPRHRHQEFRKFLNLLDTATPPDLDVHAIVDNYATHKHPAIQRWLQHHPRFHLHFVPTSASWLNLVDIGGDRVDEIADAEEVAPPICWFVR